MNVDDLLFKLLSAGIIKIPQVSPPVKSLSQKNVDIWGLLSNCSSASIIKLPSNDRTGQLNQQYIIIMFLINHWINPVTKNSNSKAFLGNTDFQSLADKSEGKAPALRDFSETKMKQ